MPCFSYAEMNSMFCQGSVESTFAGKPNEKALGIEFEETEAKMLWKEGAEI